MILNYSLEKWRKNILIQRENLFGEEASFYETDQVLVSGIIEREFEYSHSQGEKSFYKTRIRVERMNGIEDFVPVEASESLIANYLEKSVTGKYAEVSGFFKSYRQIREGPKKMFVFVKAINIYDDEQKIKENTNVNKAYFEAIICSKPIFNITPKGKKVTELVIAVNMGICRTYYINCVAFGNNALFTSKMAIGDKIKIFGKIHSREYFKSLSPDSKEGEIRTAYEIIIRNVEKEGLIES